jgi:hypothetical protein
MHNLITELGIYNFLLGLALGVYLGVTFANYSRFRRKPSPIPAMIGQSSARSAGIRCGETQPEVLRVRSIAGSKGNV